MTEKKSKKIIARYLQHSNMRKGLAKSGMGKPLTAKSGER